MNIFKFIVSISICFFVAFWGSVVTTPAIPVWYASLDKPFFTPPNWVFAPVWMLLFFLMGVSLYIIWNKKTKNKNKIYGLKIFILQLIVNLLWSLVFFGLHQPLLGFITIILLWICILITIIYFSKVSKIASQLLYPYIIWVSFASILNFAVFILNK